MNVLLTFDVEVWCVGWDRLDEQLPAAFRRCVYGASDAGEYGLPKALDLLARHRLKGVFFVEPLFSARFGARYLRTIVEFIQDAGQEVQLHLHPEWTDEISPPPIAHVNGKRQLLRHYSEDEQAGLIRCGSALLQDAGVCNVSAFRAGSFAANRDTFRALASAGIPIDSSIDATMAISVPDMRSAIDVYFPSRIEDVSEYPMAAFVDGTGRHRHAQVGACSAGELIEAIEQAEALRWDYFVILSHSFEMLKQTSSEPDWIVVRRFERLCEYLDARRDALPTIGFAELARRPLPSAPKGLPHVGRFSTLRRISEQAWRRVFYA